MPASGATDSDTRGGARHGARVGYTSRVWGTAALRVGCVPVAQQTYINSISSTAWRHSPPCAPRHLTGGTDLCLAFPHPPGLCTPARGPSLPRTARPVQVDMYVRVCVIGFGVWTVSVSVCFACYGPAHAGAAISGLHRGHRGPAPANFSCKCTARVPVAPGGCRAPVSVSGASVAQGAV